MANDGNRNTSLKADATCTATRKESSPWCRYKLIHHQRPAAAAAAVTIVAVLGALTTVVVAVSLLLSTAVSRLPRLLHAVLLLQLRLLLLRL